MSRNQNLSRNPNVLPLRQPLSRLGSYRTFVGDAAEQARFVLQKIERALKAVGATLSDVVRTRMFVVDIGEWEKIGKVHGEFFADVRPAATMVEVSRLVNPDHLIEIEVDAVVSGS